MSSRTITFATGITLESNVPSKLSHATLTIEMNRIVITNRSGVSLTLDMDAATGLALALYEEFVTNARLRANGITPTPKGDASTTR